MQIPITDSSYLHTAESTWFGVQDLLSNAYFPWRINPLLAILGGGSPMGLLSCYLLFSILSCLLYCRVSGKPFLFGITLPTSSYASVLALFGFSIPVLSFLLSIYVLLALFASTHAAHKNSTKDILLSLFGALFILLTANQLSPLALLTAVLVAKESGVPLRSDRTLFLLAILCCPLFIRPEISFPDYPSDARLVPGYGTPFGIDPLIGGKPPRPFLNREYTLFALRYPALLLGFLTFSVLIKRRTTIGLASLIIAIALVWDSAFIAGWLRLVGPVQTLTRIIPGYSFFPVSVYACTALILLVGSLCTTTSAKHGVGTLCLIPCLFFLTTKLPQSPFGTLSNPVYALENRKILESPSLFIARKEPASAFQHPVGKLINISFLSPQLHASSNEEKLKNLLDKTPSSRWSATSGSQTGTEWLEIIFPHAVTFAGIDLSTPHFSSDFPRGLEIASGVVTNGRCDELKRIYTNERWLGSVLKTPQGYPYYSAESAVKIPLPQTATQCIRISQIGTAEAYEWSVESISILTL